MDYPRFATFALDSLWDLNSVLLMNPKVSLLHGDMALMILSRFFTVWGTHQAKAGSSVDAYAHGQLFLARSTE